MTIVLDATAIVALVTGTSGADAHVARATRIVTPDLAVSEVLNVRWKYLRAGLVAPSLAAFLALFERVTLASSIDYAADADRLSQELDHPFYDTLYAAVAMRERARLVTADRRFARKLASVPIDVALFA